MTSAQPPEPEASYADLAIAAIRDRRYHAARGWLAEALDAQREARDTRIVQVPVLRSMHDALEPDAQMDPRIPPPPPPPGGLPRDLLGNRGPWRA